MRHTSLRIGASMIAAAACVIAPIPALAYLSPSDVFGTSGSPAATQTSVDSAYAPPTLRDASSRVAEQQAVAAVNRASAQASLETTLSSSAPAAPVSPIQEDAAPVPSRLDPNVAYDIRQDRIAERSAERPTIIITGNGGIVDSKGNVLHSGAPLMTSTGPASIFAVLSLLFAAIGTFVVRRVHTRMFS